MTQSIACTQQNDIFAVNGILQFVNGLDAVAQNCRSVMQAQTGEIVLDLARGVPTLATIWNTYLPAQFELAGRAMLESITDVETVQSFSVRQNKRFAIYTAEIASTFGTTTVTGNLNQ